MAKKSDLHKSIIGRFELINIFANGTEIKAPAKTDTGAFRSSVHASNIKLQDGRLRFDLFRGHPTLAKKSITVETDDFSIVSITNSFGHSEERYEVRLKVKLGHRLFSTSFTLADRSKNIFPVLIGRKILNGRFIVDTSSAGIDEFEARSKFNLDLPEA